MRITSTGNTVLGSGGLTFGTGAANGVLGLLNTATAPTTGATNAVQLYGADTETGNAGLAIMAENGATTKFGNVASYSQKDFSTVAMSPTGETKKWFFSRSLVTDLEDHTNTRDGTLTITNCYDSGDTYETASAHNLEAGQQMVANFTNANCDIVNTTAYFVCTTPSATTFTLDDSAGCGSKTVVTSDTSPATATFTMYPDSFTVPDPTVGGMLTCVINSSTDGIIYAVYVIGSDGSSTITSSVTSGKADDALASEDNLNCVDDGANTACINELGQTETVTCEMTYY
jgi:hypothetical protein